MFQNWCIDVRRTEKERAGVLIRLLCLCSSNITTCILNVSSRPGVRRQREQLKGAESSPENRSLSSDTEDTLLQRDIVYQISDHVSLGSDTMQHDGSNFSTDTNIKTPFITLKMFGHKSPRADAPEIIKGLRQTHSDVSRPLILPLPPTSHFCFTWFGGSSAGVQMGSKDFISITFTLWPESFGLQETNLQLTWRMTHSDDTQLYETGGAVTFLIELPESETRFGSRCE